MTPTRIARGKAVLNTPIRSATRPAPIRAKKAVALMIASCVRNEFVSLLSSLGRKRRKTYSVVGEEFVLCYISRVSDDVEKRNKETDHDSESTEANEPCRRLTSNLEKYWNEWWSGDGRGRGENFARSSDEVCDTENDELENSEIEDSQLESDLNEEVFEHDGESDCSNSRA